MSATLPGSGLSMNSNPVAVSPPPYAGYPSNLKNAEEYAKEDRYYDPEVHLGFSKTILKRKLLEFEAGKYTKRYIETYLEFMHLNGLVSNLEYLEFKETLAKE